ncbi:helix-turn-helix transcriptional regulator [Notoacmeibacter marinus]|uniref:helix-turn-helix transcriptional regulator n=1 Tax=Notoacmeibacter marinus TaxID=1876515 RepID=UPI000DF222D2|nr:LuxR family transcriptional regulator [Notoacmeibacter marinus]
MDADQFADYVERLRRADSRDVVWSVVCGYFDQAGFDGVFYADLAPGRAILRTNLTKCWTDHYAAEHYFDIDPFFRHSCSQLAVTSTGQDYFDEHPYLDRQERQFILTAGETGMTAGLALPVRLAGPGGVGGADPLTPRETEMLRWAASGLRTKEIAERMNVSAATVEFHGRNARQKLDAKTREQAVAIALTRGLIAM